MKIETTNSNTSSGVSSMTSNNSGTSQLPPDVTSVPEESLRTYLHTKRVGNYLVGKLLGEGSFAKVKEGLHTLTGEKVAIKIIDKKKAKEDAYVRKNLRREGKLLQLIRHDNIVRLYEIMETENSYYLVNELCQGGDLMDMICARKRLDEGDTRRYIRQVVSAVDYLHKSGILHRDVKIENLLLDENKNIKIIDFGLSNSIRVTTCTTDDQKSAQTVNAHRKDHCMTQCGSPAYAAPELLGNQKYGPPVDVWSIGVNMFAMLTGNLPFTVEPFNIKALHGKMVRREMNKLPIGVSAGCEELLKRFLEPDPEKRITLAEAMNHPWLTNGTKCPMHAAPHPNRRRLTELNQNIITYMCSNLDQNYRTGDVIKMVVNGVPSNATATYSLFECRLRRHEAEVQRRQKLETVASLHSSTAVSCSTDSIPSAKVHSPTARGAGVLPLAPLLKQPHAPLKITQQHQSPTQYSPKAAHGSALTSPAGQRPRPSHHFAPLQRLPAWTVHRQTTEVTDRASRDPKPHDRAPRLTHRLAVGRDHVTAPKLHLGRNYTTLTDTRKRHSLGATQTHDVTPTTTTLQPLSLNVGDTSRTEGHSKALLGPVTSVGASAYSRAPAYRRAKTQMPTQTPALNVTGQRTARPEEGALTLTPARPQALVTPRMRAAGEPSPSRPPEVSPERLPELAQLR